jgi:hypothetical protein
MNRLIIAFLVAAITACSAPKPLQYPVEVLPSASTIYPSPDGRVFATLRYGKQPFTVAILERESGRVLGVAKSSVKLSEDGLRMHGTLRVTYADDLSTIIVHEDFSDASPNPRYILFQRKPGNNDYRVFYCAPPTAHTDREGEFDFVCPDVRRVSVDSVTLEYPGEPTATRDLAIKDLIKTTTPASAQDMPSVSQ